MGALRGTPRQAQILELAAQGQSDKEIAVALGISVHTVRSHLQRLYRTHGLTNRAEAVAAWATTDAVVAPPTPPGAELEERLSAAAELGAAARLGLQTAPAAAQLELVNHEREVAGLAPLEWDDRLAAVATMGARKMAEQGHLGPIGPVEAAGASEIGAENVGYWPGMNDLQLHTLFVADPKQRANILGPHTHMGAAWATTEAGVSFLCVIFASRHQI